MASGREHDRSTILWGIPFAILIGVVCDPQKSLISYCSFLFGGLWLSPDLDTNSFPLKRWGTARILWIPYQKIFAHRSFWSHSPFIGTAIRISYLILIGALIIYLMSLLGWNYQVESIKYIYQVINNQLEEIIISLISIEASCWLHIIKDGDHIPLKWKKYLNLKK